MMGYIELATPISDTKKAIISLWFRVPAQVLDAMTAEFQAWVNADPQPSRRPLLGIVPLMVFGPSMTDRYFYFPTRLFGSTGTFVSLHWFDGPTGYPDCTGAGFIRDEVRVLPLGGNYWSFEQGDGILAGGGTKRDPSYIGVDCSGDRPALSVNIRMPKGNTAEWKGSWPNVVNQTITGEVWSMHGGSALCPGGPGVTIKPGYGICFEPMNSFTNTYTYESNADVVIGSESEVFRTLPGSRVGDGHDSLSPKQEKYQGQVVEPDHWHHLLLSFDFIGKISTKGVHMDGRGDPGDVETRGSATSGAKMWIAFDDKNLTGKNLSVFSSDEANSVITAHGNYIRHDVTYSITDSDDDCNGNHYTISTIQAQPEYDFTPVEVSFENLGLPASSAYVDAIKRVEMSELQIFTGISLDPADVANRRAFITDKGKPAEFVKVAGRTEKITAAEELLGKAPDVVFHLAKNWKKGKNTANSDRAGTSEKTVGDIKAWKPDPSLHGPQMPTDPNQQIPDVVVPDKVPAVS